MLQRFPPQMFSWVRAPDYCTLQKVFISHHSGHLNTMFQTYCVKFLHDILILILLFYWILKFRKCMLEYNSHGCSLDVVKVNQSIYPILKITGILNFFRMNFTNACQLFYQYSNHNFQILVWYTHGFSC